MVYQTNILIKCKKTVGLSNTNIITSAIRRYIYRFFGETRLEPSERVVCSQDGGTCSLVINGILKAEEGGYSAVASNSSGEIKASAQLNVTGKAKDYFIYRSAGKTADSGRQNSGNHLIYWVYIYIFIEAKC